MRIPAGYSLVFQMHYTTYGQATTDRSKIGLKFAKTPPKTILNTMALINASLSIPPGAPNHLVENSMTFNRETVIYSLIPHTHVRGTGWHYEATYPDGRKEVILSVPKYDFNWQHEYVFTQPLEGAGRHQAPRQGVVRQFDAQQVEPGRDQDGDVGRSDVGGNDVHQHHVLVPARADHLGAATMIAGLFALLLGGQAAAQQGTCAALATLLLPDVKITEAVAIPAAATGNVRVAHCRVNGIVGREIRFSLLLPETWNRKFVMGGGGGYVQGIDNQAIASVNAGYATVGTDTGHQGAHHGGEVGAQQHRAAVELRPSRGASRRRSLEGNHSPSLRRAGVAVVLQRLLERRPPGADGSAALPGRLRRHRLRRPGLRLHRPRRAVHQGHPGGVPDAAEPDDAAVAGRCLEERRDAGAREVRRARRRHRWRDGRSAIVHRRRQHLHGRERCAEEGAGGDLRREETRRWPDLSRAAVRRRRRRQRRLADVDRQRQPDADGRPEGAEPAVRIRYRVLQVFRLQRRGVGLPEVRLCELSQRFQRWPARW